MNSIAIKNLIREGKYTLMGNVLQTGRSQGMYTLKDNLRELFEKGLIEHEVMASFLKQDYPQQNV